MILWLYLHVIHCGTDLSYTHPVWKDVESKGFWQLWPQVIRTTWLNSLPAFGRGHGKWWWPGADTVCQQAQAVLVTQARHSFHDLIRTTEFYLFIYFNQFFFFFKLFIHFTLQHCIGFAVHWLESAMGVYVFPILNPSLNSLPIHPSGSSQCTSPEHPVSCIEPGLVICFTYDNLHVSMLFSQIIPPSLSPPEPKRLFNTSVSLLLSHIQGYRYHFSKFHIYVLVYCNGLYLSGLLHSV